MSHDRITQLRISGLRTIEDLTLDLNGLTVLIGENGTGKSSILEALELLRQRDGARQKPHEFIGDVLVKGHGGLRTLLRSGASELCLGVTIEGSEPPLTYDVAFALEGSEPSLLLERILAVEPTGAHQILYEAGRKAELDLSLNPRLALIRRVETDDRSSPRPRQPALERMWAALNSIEVQVPFDTRPLWQQRHLGLRSGPRWPSEFQPAEALARFAANLPNVFQALRNLGPEAWDRVISRSSLGLSRNVRDFRLQPVGRGEIDLEVVFEGPPAEQLLVAALSEGELSYLCFVALAELNPDRSILAFDEPELHLHPGLLTRVMMILEEVAERSPVLLATHSDHLLDTLSDPVASVAVCELDEHGATRVRRLDAERLAEWLHDYHGVGSVRGDGYLAHILADFAPPQKGPKP